MFLLRSAFWLFVAFMIIRPGLDLPAAASAIGTEAVAIGGTLVIETVASAPCATLACSGSRAVLAAVAGAHAQPNIGESSEPEAIPLPRPRPRREG